MKLNPVGMEYHQVGRDSVVVQESLADARVRELPACSENDMEGIVIGDGKKYERIHFRARDKLTAFWGLLSDIIIQRGTYVWDEDEKIGLWEVTVIEKPGIETWARKVIRYLDENGGKTKVEAFVEGYSKEALKILEGVTKKYTKDLHRWVYSSFRDVDGARLRRLEL
ncbi:hypothetical protein AN958_02890 [Leucoagaricus sp. SymC.cos]|nr:hypothetical protein AN958_02890 [Leucoagaricus sp. SymC.cos]